jgi:hypothetical protein
MFVLFPLALIILIIYLLVKKKGNDNVNLHHAYYYLVSFVTLGILFWAVPDLIRLLLDKYVFTETTSYSYSSYSSSAQNIFLKRIAGRLSATIVAFPVWGFHWMKANPPKPDESFNNKYRKSYFLAVVIVSITFMLIGWPYLLYTLISKVLGVTDNNINEILSTSIPYTFSATFLWLTHFKVWKNLSSSNNKKEKFDIKPPLKAEDNKYTSDG